MQRARLSVFEASCLIRSQKRRLFFYRQRSGGGLSCWLERRSRWRRIRQRLGIRSEIAQLLSIGRVEDVNRSRPIAGDHARTVVVEGRVQRDVGKGVEGFLGAAVRLPGFGGFIAPGRGDSAIVRER